MYVQHIDRMESVGLGYGGLVSLRVSGGFNKMSCRGKETGFCCNGLQPHRGVTQRVCAQGGRVQSSFFFCLL